MKERNRVRYIGVTSTSQNRDPDLMELMRNEPLDFIGVDRRFSVGTTPVFPY